MGSKGHETVSVSIDDLRELLRAVEYLDNENAEAIAAWNTRLRTLPAPSEAMIEAGARAIQNLWAEQTHFYFDDLKKAARIAYLAMQEAKP